VWYLTAHRDNLEEVLCADKNLLKDYIIFSKKKHPE
jgi:hypothetical protein